MENPQYKVHKAMAAAGIENCRVEVIEDNFVSFVDLALAEIQYIKEYDSKNNGLNSTYGGDGLGKHLHLLSDAEIQTIKKSLSAQLSEYNNKVKWAGTTANERKAKTAHLHTDDIVAKRTDTLKKFYNANPNIKKEKGKPITEWQVENRDQLLTQNRQNCEKAALINRKKVKVITPDGETIVYESKQAFGKVHGNIINNIIKKTSSGTTHKGWQGWEIE